MTTKIVADSSSDLLELSGVAFESAPLKIITSEKEYVDDASLNVLEMVTDLLNYNGRSSTSCPNANDWLCAFGDAEQVFCVTITATLSGSYNAAMQAKQIYEERYPGRRVCVLNSLSTGPEMVLMIEKIRDLILEGKEFDDICSDVTKYTKKTGLLFMLESMKNLANNGRVSPLVAKVAGILSIRVVGKASDKGDLEQLNKCRGEKKALETIVQHLKSLGLNKGKVRIAHCFNESAGKALKELIQKEFSKVQVEICKCRGLCSFYAEKGGLLVGFEKI
ncbi:MAG: DegV family protein [Ruminococcaceae bacterium]|nr:DegV family protein [Oscillospiraceae bacterium]